MLTEIAERAIAHTRAPELLIVGGFARNQRFQSMLQEICKDWKMKMLVCPYKYASDNGTMIAWGGILQYKAVGALKTEESQVLPDWRSDAVKIAW